MVFKYSFMRSAMPGIMPEDRLASYPFARGRLSGFFVAPLRS